MPKRSRSSSNIKDKSPSKILKLLDSDMSSPTSRDGSPGEAGDMASAASDHDDLNGGAIGNTAESADVGDHPTDSPEVAQDAPEGPDGVFTQVIGSVASEINV
jgi:hypothetical protein